MNDLKKRRKFLVNATLASGAVATGFAAVPFISYLKPSTKAKVGAAPIEVDVSGLDAGRLMRKLWKGRPIFIVHRSQEMLGSLLAIEREDILEDPQSQAEETQQPDDKVFNESHRSRDPSYVVLVGVCTHLGCAPLYRPEIAPEDLGADWKGGFYCPCHGSKFDLSGRVYKGVPAPTNLPVPPYVIDGKRITIG